MRKNIIRLRAENHGCKPVDECEQIALRRMSLESIEGGPAEAKRRRVNKGATPVKAWGSIARGFFFLFLFSAAQPAFAKEITVLFTGDTHAALYPCHCPIEPDGGLLRRATLIRQIIKNTPDTILVDAGGLFAGGVMDENSLNSELDKERTKIAVAAISSMGYDALGISEEEFNFGAGFLEELILQTKTAFIASNISGSPAYKPYLIKEVTGIKVGIVALIAAKAQAKAQGIKITDPLIALHEAVRELRGQGAALVVVLSRLGESQDLNLIKATDGVDLFISGLNTKSEQLVKIGNTFVAGSIWQGRKLGKLTLKMRQGKLQDAKLEYIRLSGKVSDDQVMGKIIPACFSDSDCRKKGFISYCQNPAAKSAACVFSAPAKVGLQVITAKAAKFIETERVVNYLKERIPGLAVNYLSYPDLKAQELVTRLNIQALPVYLIDKGIENEQAFEKLKTNLEPAGELYLLRPQFAGVAYFLKRNKSPGRLDVFISLYDKSTQMLLSAIKEFRPQLHFLAVENGGTFEAKNGQLEVEDDLRAVCVQQYYPQIFWDYILCRSKNTATSWWEDCLGNFSSEKIKACARSDEGRQLLKGNAALNRELEVMYGPTYLLDNQEIFSTQGPPSKDELRKILGK